MVYHQQQLLAKPVQELSYDPCRVPESVSCMRQYGFHHKLGYVNCKGVLEYGTIGAGASASMLLHRREEPTERHIGQRGNLQVGMR